MNFIEGAEKLDYIIKRYKDLKTINNKELIDDIFEKYLGHFIEESDAYIKEINAFTNKEQFKINIYAYIYSLFICNHRAEKMNDEFVEESLSTIFSILLEANKNIKAEREISEGYKYALDKLDGIKWHPYPKEKPSMDDVYIVSLVINSEKPYSWISYYRKEDGFSEDYNGSVVNAWAELPEPYEG